MGPQTAPDADEHYLKRELYALAQADADVFEFLQAGSLDGIWYWDLDAPEHEWMSPRFWEVLGYDHSDREHFASEWQDLICQEDLQRALDAFHAHAADPSVPYDVIVRYKHGAGSTVWIRCRGICIRDAHGKPIRMLGAHTDITAHKEAEARARALAEQLVAANAELDRANAELEEANAQLRSSNAELRQFAYAAGHDLREPMRMVAQHVSLLARKYSDAFDERGQKHLGYAIEGATRMQEMLDGLMALSELDRELELTRVPLARVVSRALRHTPEIDAVCATVGELPDVLGHEANLLRVFQNLFSNAHKFRSSSPLTLHIEATTSPGFVEVEVRDNGIGFDQDDAQRIFHLFQRLHPRDEYPGSGFGLAIAARIAERHGGSIRATSSAGAGASFFVCLPLAPAVSE